MPIPKLRLHRTERCMLLGKLCYGALTENLSLLVRFRSIRLQHLAAAPLFFYGLTMLLDSDPELLVTIRLGLTLSPQLTLLYIG